jgi:hypothetical protein
VGVTFAAWIEGALPRPPTVADLEYHISTLFPPIRPRGFMEVRYVDGQAGDEWMLPVAVLAAVTSSPEAVDRAREICEPTRDLWATAARQGLDHPELARAAAEVFALALHELPRTGASSELGALLADVTDRRVLAGRCPADEFLPGEGPGVLDPAAVPFPPGLFTQVLAARHHGPNGRSADMRAAKPRTSDTPGTGRGDREPGAARHPGRTASDQPQGVHPGPADPTTSPPAPPPRSASATPTAPRPCAPASPGCSNGPGPAAPRSPRRWTRRTSSPSTRR